MRTLWVRLKDCQVTIRHRSSPHECTLSATLLRRRGERRLSLVRVDQPPRTEPGKDLVQTRIRHGEATLAATEHSEVSDDFPAHVPRTVHHDGPRRRTVVGRVEALETHRAAVLAYV